MPPRLRCRLGLAAGPNDPLSGVVWTDVTARIRRDTTSNRGKQHELDRFESGTVSVELDNRDRGLDPIVLAGPIKPRIPMQLYAEWSSSDYDIYTGLVEASPMKYSRGVDAYVVLKAADAFKTMNKYKPSLSPYSLRVLDETPDLYWRLGELTGQTAYDISGNDRHGAITGGVSLGRDSGLVADLDKAVRMGSFAQINGGNVLNIERTTPFAVKARVLIGHDRALFIAGRVLGFAGWELRIAVDGFVQFSLTNTVFTNDLRVLSGIRVDDKRWHEIFVLYDGTSDADTVQFIIDGADGGLVKVADTLSATTLVAADFKAGVSTQTDPFLLDELAVFTGSVFPAETAREIYEEGVTPWRSQRSGERIGRLLDIQEWPSADRDIDRGVATLSSVQEPLETILEPAQKAAESEAGALYITADGKIALDDRYVGVANSASIATFGEGGLPDLPYEEIDPSFDDEDLYTEVHVTREGTSVKLVLVDQTAKDEYGQIVLPVEGQWADDNQATSVGERLLARYAQPRLRFPSIKPARTSDVWTVLLGLRVHRDRITVEKQPRDANGDSEGAVISQECIVEGISWRINRDRQRWECTLSLVPAEASINDLFVIGTSALGSTDKLAW